MMHTNDGAALALVPGAFDAATLDSVVGELRRHRSELQPHTTLAQEDRADGQRLEALQGLHRGSITSFIDDAFVEGDSSSREVITLAVAPSALPFTYDPNEAQQLLRYSLKFCRPQQQQQQQQNAAEVQQLLQQQQRQQTQQPSHEQQQQQQQQHNDSMSSSSTPPDSRRRRRRERERRREQEEEEERRHRDEMREQRLMEQQELQRKAAARAAAEAVSSQQQTQLASVVRAEVSAALTLQNERRAATGEAQRLQQLIAQQQQLQIQQQQMLQRQMQQHQDAVAAAPVSPPPGFPFPFPSPQAQQAAAAPQQQQQLQEPSVKYLQSEATQTPTRDRVSTRQQNQQQQQQQRPSRINAGASSRPGGGAAASSAAAQLPAQRRVQFVDAETSTPERPRRDCGTDPDDERRAQQGAPVPPPSALLLSAGESPPGADASQQQQQQNDIETKSVAVGDSDAPLNANFGVQVEIPLPGPFMKQNGEHQHPEEQVDDNQQQQQQKRAGEGAAASASPPAARSPRKQTPPSQKAGTFKSPSSSSSTPNKPLHRQQQQQRPTSTSPSGKTATPPFRAPQPSPYSVPLSSRQGAASVSPGASTGGTSAQRRHNVSAASSGAGAANRSYRAPQKIGQHNVEAHRPHVMVASGGGGARARPNPAAKGKKQPQTQQQQQQQRGEGDENQNDTAASASPPSGAASTASPSGSVDHHQQQSDQQEQLAAAQLIRRRQQHPQLSTQTQLEVCEPVEAVLVPKGVDKVEGEIEAAFVLVADQLSRMFAMPPMPPPPPELPQEAHTAAVEQELRRYLEAFTSVETHVTQVIVNDAARRHALQHRDSVRRAQAQQAAAPLSTEDEIRLLNARDEALHDSEVTVLEVPGEVVNLIGKQDMAAPSQQQQQQNNRPSPSSFFPSRDVGVGTTDPGELRRQALQQQQQQQQEEQQRESRQQDQREPAAAAAAPAVEDMNVSAASIEVEVVEEPPAADTQPRHDEDTKEKQQENEKEKETETASAQQSEQQQQQNQQQQSADSSEKAAAPSSQSPAPASVAGGGAAASAPIGSDQQQDQQDQQRQQPTQQQQQQQQQQKETTPARTSPTTGMATRVDTAPAVDASHELPFDPEMMRSDTSAPVDHLLAAQMQAVEIEKARQVKAEESTQDEQQQTQENQQQQQQQDLGESPKKHRHHHHRHHHNKHNSKSENENELLVDARGLPTQHMFYKVAKAIMRAAGGGGGAADDVSSASSSSSYSSLSDHSPRHHHHHEEPAIQPVDFVPTPEEITDRHAPEPAQLVPPQFRETANGFGMKMPQRLVTPAPATAAPGGVTGVAVAGLPQFHQQHQQYHQQAQTPNFAHDPHGANAGTPHDRAMGRGHLPQHIDHDHRFDHLQRQPPNHSHYQNQQPFSQQQHPLPHAHPNAPNFHHQPDTMGGTPHGRAMGQGHLAQHIAHDQRLGPSLNQGQSYSHHQNQQPFSQQQHALPHAHPHAPNFHHQPDAMGGTPHGRAMGQGHLAQHIAHDQRFGGGAPTASLAHPNQNYQNYHYQNQQQVYRLDPNLYHRDGRPRKRPRYSRHHHVDSRGFQHDQLDRHLHGDHHHRAQHPYGHDGRLGQYDDPSRLIFGFFGDGQQQHQRHRLLPRNHSRLRRSSSSSSSSSTSSSDSHLSQITVSTPPSSVGRVDPNIVNYNNVTPFGPPSAFATAGGGAFAAAPGVAHTAAAVRDDYKRALQRIEKYRRDLQYAKDLDDELEAPGGIFDSDNDDIDSDDSHLVYVRYKRRHGAARLDASESSSTDSEERERKRFEKGGDDEIEKNKMPGQQKRVFSSKKGAPATRLVPPSEHGTRTVFRPEGLESKS